MLVAPGQILENVSGSEVLPSKMRVMAVWPTSDVIWLIELPRKHPKIEGRMLGYVKAPQRDSLSRITKLMAEFQIVASNFVGRALLDLTDEQILATATNQRELKKLRKMLRDRDARWETLYPVLTGSASASAPRSFSEIMADPGLGAKLIARARELGKAPSTLYNLLHLYFALGLRKNSLCTGLWRCGNPGKPKEQKKKLGRKSRLHARGEAGPGYVLSNSDKEKLQHGYKLIKHQSTSMDAYLDCCGTFWATREVGEDGASVVRLLPEDERPTFDQFMYWGPKGNDNKSVSRILMGESKWDQLTGTQGKSVQDQVSSVAQLACFDGTSTDVYLTSIRSRLVKLPPMTRLILKEVRTGIIYGLHCGWEAPSASTALQTILHGAQSKVDFCKRFGIDIKDEDWPYFLCKTHQADNGELKAEKITEAEVQFSFAVEYAQSGRGDKKGSVETQHHTDHLLLDHRLPGTTKGRRRKRGEAHPATLALWNYYEYVRELIFHVLDYNKQEAPDLAPLEMLREQPELPPTRINIFKWLRDKGMTSELSYDLAALRAFTLPDQPAVIRKNGVHLMASFDSDLRVVPKLRYSSEQLVETGSLSKVKQSGTSIRVNLKIDPSDLRRCWLPTPLGMLELELQSSDSLLREMSLPEWCHWLEEMSLETGLRKGHKQQSRLNVLLRRRATTDSAKHEAATEKSKLPKALSKAAQVRNLKRNRDTERAFIASSQRSEHKPKKGSEAESTTPDQQLVNVEVQRAAESAAARAMKKFKARGSNAQC